MSALGNRSVQARGSALILVLVTVVLLAGLAALFSLESLESLQEARNVRDGAASRMLAHAGLEAAIAELSLQGTRCVKDGWGEVYFLRSSQTEESELIRVRKSRTGRELEDGYGFSWAIRPVWDRADLNLLTSAQWHRVFELACNIPEGAARTALVNAILDWRDIDDTLLTEGAEKEYYEGLQPPRSCKNSNIDTLEEMLLIKGITPDLLWGDANAPLTEGAYHLLYGGGLARYVAVGTRNQTLYAPDNPELKYILTGTRDENFDRRTLIMTPEERDVISNYPRPERLMVIARGWLRGGVARHASVAVLKGAGNTLAIEQWDESAVDHPWTRSLWDGYTPHTD